MAVFEAPAAGRLSLTTRMRRWLPHGGSLPPEEWPRRHRGIMVLLWLNVLAVPLYGIVAGRSSLIHDIDGGAALAVMAALGSTDHLSRKLRAAAATLGLMGAAALLIAASGGLLEMHFYFFVLIIVLTLYEDWMPFLLSVAFVLIHHGVLGTLDPRAVFDRRAEYEHPWTWAAIHAGFVAAAGAAALSAWRLNENVRAQMRDTSQRLRLVLSENEQLLAASQIEAHTDALTGLPNRRALMRDLDAALPETASQRAMTLALFDLNGFKQYNDTFGHLAGDALLTRVGERLRIALSERGTAYRMGGDEFCILAINDAHGGEEIAQEAAGALSESGEAFSIDCSHGTVHLPEEASTPEQALRLADQRMYELKAGRTSASRQSTDVLLTALCERSPMLSEHISEVAQLSRMLAIQLSLPEAEVKRIELAGELHDIGKVAIPDTILNKPGPLDEEEWEFIHRHPEIGERIVAAAPSIAHTAPLVRSHHERYDGRGYPDRLKRDEIPIGAAIIAVCDSFGAMTKRRPYSDAISVADALAELRRCAGHQYDPDIVASFCELIEQPAGPSSRTDSDTQRSSSVAYT
jgi:diguanylate cyclase (GGDEF)-like protein